MKAETKKTEMECTKIMGFVAGACVKAELIDVHSSMLLKSTTKSTRVIADRTIEIKN